MADNKPGITSKYTWLMPDEPHKVYEEFVSWDDWLGVPLTYDEAREAIASLGIESQQEWWEFSRSSADRLQTLRVPSRPHLFYDKWLGYDHWLSLEETPLVFNPADFSK